MTTVRAALLLVVLLAGLGAMTASALAQEDEPATTTEASTPASETSPAVVVEPGDEAPETEAWTFRYMVPAFIVLTLLAVLAVGIGYLVRVRGRYVVRQ